VTTTIEIIARALAAEAFDASGNENDAERQNIIDRRWQRYLPQAEAVSSALAPVSIVSVVAGWADRIKNGRTLDEIVESIRDETVELDEEVVKANNGDPAGPDGIFGEAVDIMVSTIDIVREARPNMPLEELEVEVARYAEIKCQKWARKYG
jgi:hypothetical protein